MILEKFQVRLSPNLPNNSIKKSKNFLNKNPRKKNKNKKSNQKK
jgi:hypothetical protein